MSPSKKTIIISGFYGAGNLGDELILHAIIYGIKTKRPNWIIKVLSFNPAETERIHDVQTVSRRKFGIGSLLNKRIWTALMGADIILIGGGGLFQDVKDWGSIPRYLIITLMAKILNKPVLYYAVGIGPIRSRFHRLFFRFVSDKVDLITVRDKMSLETLRSIGVKKPSVFITADPVFLLSSPFSKVKSSEKLQIGICIREWPGLFKEEVAKFADWLVNFFSADVIFIPMEWTKDDNSDIVACNTIISLMKEKAKLFQRKLLPEDFLDFISNLNLVIGMRLHTLISAAIMGVPMIGLSYDPKVKALFHDLDMEDMFLELQDLNFDNLKEKIEYVLTEHDALKTKLKNRVEILQKRSQKNIDLLIKYKRKSSSVLAILYLISCLAFFSIAYLLIKRIKRHER